MGPQVCPGHKAGRSERSSPHSNTTGPDRRGAGRAGRLRLVGHRATHRLLQHLVFLLLFIVAGLVVAGLLIVRLRESNVSSPSAPPPPSAFSGAPVPPQPSKSTSEVVCWGCNKPISGIRRACPGCGARYHESGYACSASALVICRNCQADISTFVEEVSS